MEEKAHELSYNERLFGKGIRSTLHTARFDWLKKQVSQLNYPVENVLELGCFDAKTIDYLPKMPKYYLGYDANWEDGLEVGKEKWKNNPNIDLRPCNHPLEFNVAENAFDISICQETLEHLPSDELEIYLQKLAFATKGHCFISVPNEKGYLFFFKHLIKKMTNNQQEEYTFAEFCYASMGKLSKVERNECQHKGFDYDVLIQQVSKYFKNVESVGIPYNNLPKSANFTIGIIAKK
jgi:2-polyprenyl-3-methyl-5-hydroxy-6-metoxy-1,4-benzoquinol methylase